MTQSRLSNLVIISIENEEAKAIGRVDSIFNFASLTQVTKEDFRLRCSHI